MKKILGALAIVLMVGACANTTDDKEEKVEDSTEQTEVVEEVKADEESSVEEQSKKESASSEAEQSAKDESFEAQLESEYSSMVKENSKNPELEAELNEHINGMISEVQGYFNPDDPNTYQFAPSTYINEVQFDTSSNDIYVSVNNDFLLLSDSDKSVVANSAQGLTIGALVEKEYDLTTSEKQGMFTTVLNGQNTVGSSKVLDVREYTWY